MNKPTPAELARLEEARASDAAWTRAVAAEIALRMQHARAEKAAAPAAAANNHNRS
jgi:hypothetical protein